MKNTIIPGDRIASGTITSQQIASGTITNQQIASGTITNEQIARGTITGSNIASGTITQSNIAPPSTASLKGTSAGSITYIQVNSLSTYKKVLLYANGYENTTSTAQTVTYPVPFSTVAAITANTTGMTVSTSLTALTLPTSMSSAASGVIVVEGY